MSKSTVRRIIIFIALAAVIALALFHFNQPEIKVPKRAVISIRNQPHFGSRNANLHIVAFEDMKCGNCMRYNLQLLPKIKKQYIDTGKADYMVVTLAFIPGSMPAGNAALCAYAQSKKAFLDYVHYIYEHQPDETTDWATIPKLLDFASQVPSVNVDKLSACLLHSTYSAQLIHNFNLAKQVMGDTVMTPSVYINGFLVRPLTMERFQQIAKVAEHDE